MGVNASPGVGARLVSTSYVLSYSDKVHIIVISAFASGRAASGRRHFGVDATSLRRIDVDGALFGHCMPTG